MQTNIVTAVLILLVATSLLPSDCGTMAYASSLRAPKQLPSEDLDKKHKEKNWTPQHFSKDLPLDLDWRRKNNNNNKQTGRSGFVQTTLSVSPVESGGMPPCLTIRDLDEPCIDITPEFDAFTDAYNEVANNGYVLGRRMFQNIIVVPMDDDDESLAIALSNSTITNADASSLSATRAREFHYTWSIGDYTCRLCPNEDDYGRRPPPRPRPRTWLSLAPEVHGKVEERACELLRATGIPAYAKVRRCTMEFAYSSMIVVGEDNNSEDEEDDDDDDEQEQVQDVPEQMAAMDVVAKKHVDPITRQIKGQVHLHHVKLSDNGSSSSTLDIGVLSSCFIDAFNDVYSAHGMTGIGFQVTRILQVPDDASASLEASTAEAPSAVATPATTTTETTRYGYSVVFVTLDWTCADCDNSIADIRPRLVKAFEEIFCYKLKSSGALEYAKVEECNIVFTHGGDDSPDLALRATAQS